MYKISIFNEIKKTLSPDILKMSADSRTRKDV